MKLIVGLGNPGKEYEYTKHNAGFLALDALYPALLWTKKFDGLFAEDQISGEKVLFLKPMTFMNRSGTSVGQIANFYKISPKDILVLHDEIDFPLAKIQVKFGGSPAGHNGLKSIIAVLGTQDFWRIRIGVDRPSNPAFSVAEYVLGKFSQEEWSRIDNKMNDIETAIISFLAG